MSHHFKGFHMMLDFYNVAPNNLNPLVVRSILMEACRLSKLKMVSFTHHNFEPAGYSIVILLQESHISAHTWPEHGGVMVDLFTCGDTEVDKAIQYLKEQFMGDMGYCTEHRAYRGTQPNLFKAPITDNT